MSGERFTLEQADSDRGGHARIIVRDTPAPGGDLVLRIARVSDHEPFLGPEGWSSVPTDLPVRATAVAGALHLELGPTIVDRIEDGEFVRIDVPALNLQRETAWPPMRVSARGRGRRLVETPPETDGDLVKVIVVPPPQPEPPKPVADPPARADSPSDPPRSEVPRPEVPPTAARAVDPARKPRRGLFAALAAALLLLAAGAWAAIMFHPLQVTPAEHVITGPAGGPFAPQSVTFEVRRPAWIAPIQALVWGEPPPITIDVASSALEASAAPTSDFGWVIRVAPTGDAAALSPGEYRFAILRDGRDGTRPPRGAVSFVVGPPEPMLSVEPERGIVFRGPVGGPFVAGQDVVTVVSDASGASTRSASWRLDALPDWLAADRTRGTVPAGGRDEIRLSPARPAFDYGVGRRDGGVVLLESDTERRLEIPVALEIVPPTLAVTPPVIEFVGPRGGPFDPDSAAFSVTGTGGRAVWTLTGAGDWLEAGPTSGSVAEGRTASVRVAPGSAAASLPVGVYERSVSVRVDGGATTTRTVRLTIEEPIDYAAACDAFAGFAFDDDRPRGSGFLDDAGSLTNAQLLDGLAFCGEARESDAGGSADRRHLVQEGRLLAERAVRAALAGDTGAARRDMERAQGLWATAAARGSGTAMNLLGAFYNGTFNRSSRYDFVREDQRRAMDWWRRSSESGNAVGRHNYAVGLLYGRGARQDVSTALSLLRRASEQGYARSTYVLGEALYFGAPSQVGRDRATGARLLGSVACTEARAREILEEAVTGGSLPRSYLPICRS